MSERVQVVREIEEIVRQCREVYRPEGVLIWLFASNRTLHGATPMECVERGETALVLQVLEQLTTTSVLVTSLASLPVSGEPGKEKP